MRKSRLSVKRNKMMAIAQVKVIQGRLLSSPIEIPHAMSVTVYAILHPVSQVFSDFTEYLSDFHYLQAVTLFNAHLRMCSKFSTATFGFENAETALYVW